MGHEKVAASGQRKGGVGLTWRTILEDFGKGWSLNSLTLPSALCPPLSSGPPFDHLTLVSTPAEGQFALSLPVEAAL